MSAHDSNPLFDQIEAQQGFLRRMARQLVGEDRADDLMQDTWVAALENPPDKVAAPRGWLRRVLTNRRASQFLRDQRRVAREEAVARPPDSAGPEDIQARLEMVQRVAAAVDALPEAFRQVVYMRIYDDRQPAEIARTLGVPVETVYSRLRRGKALLRERLDADYGGERAVWSALLLPFCRLPLAPVLPVADAPQVSAPTDSGGASAARPPLASAPLLAKAILMGTKTLLVAAVAVAAALTYWFTRATTGAGDELSDVVTTLPAEPASQSDPVPSGVTLETPRATPQSGVREALPSQALEVVASTRAAASLSVTYATDGAPVAGAHGALHIGSFLDPIYATPLEFVLNDAGRMRFDDLTPGAWRVELYGRATWEVFLPRGTDTPLEFRVEQGISVHGKVLSQDEEPVPGAEVLLVKSAGETGVALATTDSRGRFRLRDLAPWRQSGPYTEISARAAGYLSAERRDVTGEVGAELELVFRLFGEGGALSGVVRAEDGRPVANAAILFPEHDSRSSSFVTQEGESFSPARALVLRTDTEGRFETTSAPLGSYGVRVRAPGYPERTAQVEAKRKAGEPVTIVLSEGGAVAGVVRDEDEASLANHIVRALGNGEQQYRYTTTDSEGRFLIEGLPVGPANLTCRGADLERQEQSVQIVSGRTAEIELRFERGTHAAGTLLDDEGEPLPLHCVCIIEPDKPGLWVRSTHTDAAGRFQFEDVPAGDKAFEIRTPSPFDSPPLLIAPWPDVDGEITLIVPPAGRPESVLRFRILDSDGSPLEGVEWWLSHASVNWGKQGFSGTDGRSEQTDLVAGSYVLTLRKAGAVELHLTEIEVPARDVLDLGDLRLRAGGTLDVSLRSSDPARAEVQPYATLHPLDGGESRTLYPAVNRLQSQLLLPGEYTLRFSGHDIALRELPVRIDAGQTTSLDVTLEPGTYRAFRFEPPLPAGEESSVELYGPDGTLFSGMRVVTAEEATVFGLWKGTWRLVVHGTDGLRGELSFAVEELGYPTDYIVLERR